MIVITHHGIGTNIYREGRGELLDTLYKPALAVIEISARYRIVPAKIGAPDTSRYAMIVRRVIKRDLLVTGASHNAIHFLRRTVDCREFQLLCKKLAVPQNVTLTHSCVGEQISLHHANKY